MSRTRVLYRYRQVVLIIHTFYINLIVYYNNYVPFCLYELAFGEFLARYTVYTYMGLKFITKYR